MAGYPQQEHFTYERFFARLEELGVFVTFHPEMTYKDGGEEFECTELVREVGGRTLPFLFVRSTAAAHADWSEVRSVCAALEIEPAAFGLHLD
ncbi:hypothetical protein HY251_14540 [bacterium]|nr:hypothetical protein [bacterium]